MCLRRLLQISKSKILCLSEFFTQWSVRSQGLVGNRGAAAKLRSQFEGALHKVTPARPLIRRLEHWFHYLPPLSTF